MFVYLIKPKTKTNHTYTHLHGKLKWIPSCVNFPYTINKKEKKKQTKLQIETMKSIKKKVYLNIKSNTKERTKVIEGKKGRKKGRTSTSGNAKRRSYTHTCKAE